MDSSLNGDAYIPALEPYGLAVVPGPTGPDDDEGRERWLAWAADVEALRRKIHALCDRDPQARADELATCAADWAYACCIWGHIYEPRSITGKPAKTLPYLLMAFQVKLIQHFRRVCEMPEQHDSWWSKARGLGASWTLCWCALMAWRFTQWSGGLVSAKEELVETRNNVNSLFGKIDFFLIHLPDWWKPPGFIHDHRNGGHRMHRSLVHPDPKNPAILRGATTTGDAFRSDRYTFAIYDEGSAHDKLEDAVNAGAGSTDHQFGCATESFEHGRDWRNLCDAAEKADRDNPAAEPRYLTLDWHLNPYYTPARIDRERRRAIAKGNLAGFEREFMRDPWAGATNNVYPEAVKIPTLHRPYTGSEQVIVAIDPGHLDDTAVIWGIPTGSRAADDRGVHWLGCYERNKMPVEFWAHLLTGIEPQAGDVCWADDGPSWFGDREQAIMAFFRDLPWQGSRVRFVMDPAGRQEHNGLSFYDLFFKHTLALRRRVAGDEQKPVGIAPLSDYLKGTLRYFDERRNATRPMIGRMSVEHSAERIRECLVNLEKAPQGKNATAETKQLHNEYSHAASAVEYACVGIAYGFADPKAEKKKAASRRPAILSQRPAHGIA